MRLQHVSDPEHSRLWLDLWRSDPVQHPYWLQSELRAAAAHFQPVYYLPEGSAYRQDADTLLELIPDHVVAVDDDGPVLGMSITVERHADRTRLSAFGRPLYLVWAQDADERRSAQAARMLHRHLSDLAERYRTNGFHLRDHLRNGRLSPLAEQVMVDGGRAVPYFTQVVDLEHRELTDIAANLRDNFRRIIRRRHGDLEVRVVAGADAEPHYDELLYKLHVAMRGREVRSLDYWRATLDCVRAGDGFLVVGSENGADLAAAYFACSEKYCFYSTAAHEPDAKHGGISHLLLWRAIEHAKRIGCRRLEVGDRIYPGQHGHVDAKLHSISHFKAGFGSAAAVRMDVLAGPAASAEPAAAAEPTESTEPTESAESVASAGEGGDEEH